MNLILLFPSDFKASGRVQLTGRRLHHVFDIIKPKLNDTLVVGLAGGHRGVARVVHLDGKSLELELSLTETPPPKLPVVLCVALMRPIVFKRVLQTAVSMGVERIIFFHSKKVEKSFWQSTSLEDDSIQEQVVLGLEQAKDTVIPEVFFYKKFKPFVEDVLPVLLKDRRGLVADPSGEILNMDRAAADPLVLVIGPEGGFIPYELEKFKEAGCQVVSLGERILKVETAIVMAVSRTAQVRPARLGGFC
ncbi:MAG: 16S rRNA (uracil(1498)-N(3))-methyltransferase [Candidatus Omnitrophica bacterium]|nr:16S rRNA (uracil(1498)-N(3))-methyltransferase [Candidatus Omnitrophota bacterium]